MDDNTPKCTETVSEGTGFHFHQCENKAKWLVRGNPRCGVHAKKDNYYVKAYGRVAIKKKEDTSHV